MFPIIAVGFIVLFQVGVTFWLWRSDLYIRSEKIAQTKLVWLVPALGAATVLAMLLHESKR